jgi:hypothetical protein
MTMRTYQHSGIVPLQGALMTTAAGCLAGLFLGVIYSFSFYYIPYVYLNFVLACAFGGGVGWTVGFTAREGKIRNVAVVGVLAVLTGLAGIYAEWGSTVYAMSPAADLPQLWQQAGLSTFLPHYVAAAMIGLFEKGSWGLSAGTTVHGWPLVALWIIEAGVILCVATRVAVNQIATRPFCENCQEWIAGRTPHFYVGEGHEPVWSEVQHGTFESLAMTPRANGNEPTYVKLSLSVCDGCDEGNYLTIASCKNTTDAKGNPRLEEKNIITNLILQPAQVEIVQAANWIAPEVGSPSAESLAKAQNWTLQEAAK